MQISATELSHLLNGTLEGNPDVVVSGPSKIEEGTPGTISFLAVSYTHLTLPTSYSV